MRVTFFKPHGSHDHPNLPPSTSLFNAKISDVKECALWAIEKIKDSQTRINEISFNKMQANVNDSRERDINYLIKIPMELNDTFLVRWGFKAPHHVPTYEEAEKSVDLRNQEYLRSYKESSNRDTLCFYSSADMDRWNRLQSFSEINETVPGEMMYLSMLDAQILSYSEFLQQKASV